MISIYKGIKKYLFFGIFICIFNNILLVSIPLLYSKIIVELLTSDNINLFNDLKYYLIYKILSNTLNDIRDNIFNNCVFLINNKIKIKIIKKIFNNNIITNENINDDIYNISNFYSQSANILIKIIIQFIILSYILIKKSIILYIICFIFCYIKLCIFNIIFKNNIENTNYINIDYFKNIEIYKILSLENFILDKITLPYFNNKKYLNIIITNFLNNFLLFIIIYIGLILNINNKNIYSFILYYNIIIDIINSYLFFKNNLNNNKKNIENIFNIINKKDTELYIPKDMINYKPNIYINNISFSYDKLYVIKDFTLHINFNTILNIKGKSGSGKTTLLKLIANINIIKENDGSIVIDYVNINNYDKKNYYNKIVSYSDQEPILFFKNKKDNILLNIEEPDLNIYRKINDFTSDIDDNFEELSTGQKKRISLCRSIIKKPKILLLDDPLSSLDIYNKIKFLELIRKIKSLYQLTIIIASNNKMIENISDKIVYL